MTKERAPIPFLNSVPREPIDGVIDRVQKGYDAMFKALREGKRGKEVPEPGPPRRASDVGLQFRGEKKGTKLVSTTPRFGYWLIAGAAKLGLFKVRMHRGMPEGREVREVHITRAADGWYISFSCLVPEPEPLPVADTDIRALDLGCIHRGDKQRVATADTGKIYETTDNLKKKSKRLKTLQRLVDKKRKVKGSAKAASPTSNRTKKRRKQIARLHQDTKRQREHELQWIARDSVDSAEVIVFEDVDWQALRKSGGSRKRGLNRSLSTAAPGRLIWLTQDKAQLAGRTVVKVPAAYTSQDCSVCGARGEKKGLGVRFWRCSECGTEHDRDINAARNIANRARLTQT